MKVSDTPMKHLLLAVCLVLASIIVYWPGINGPFLFDDIANILANDYLRISDLSYYSLKNAAFSSEAGPLNRPIPVLTFALNFYFNNGSASAFPFKVTNVVIHCINGLLVFWFLFLVLDRLVMVDQNFSHLQRRHVFLFSFGASLLWTAHPIHLTSVLYVVQRMTSLSASFTLLALIAYLKGRTVAISGRSYSGAVYGIGGGTIFGLLGLYSKENAALLPLYIILLEITLYSQERPWMNWRSLPARTRYVAVAVSLFIGVLAAAYLVNHFMPGYAGKQFTFSERVLTEPRVILYYLYLIFLPRIQAFGIFHDDIPVSSNLLSPWSTIPSIFAIGLLLYLSVLLFRRHRLISFAILWFFVSHLMESTIVALELVHEHRNYLAAIGPILIIIYLTYRTVLATGRKWVWWIPGLYLALFVANTSLRAWHWSDLASLNDFEVRNHPRSARAQASFGSMLAEAGKLDDAMQAFLLASSLRPYEVADLINVYIILVWQKKEMPDELKSETMRRVQSGRITPLTSQALAYAVNCASGGCAALQDDLLVWLPIYISRLHNSPRQLANFRFLYAQILLRQTKVTDAIASLEEAISVYPRYLHPYFLLAGIYINIGNIEGAKLALDRLTRANINNPHPRGREILALAKKIDRMENKPSQ